MPSAVPARGGIMSTPVQFKTIVYRGGIVRFRIPAHWIEEYEHEGGGTFYEEGQTRVRCG
jgi:hypothetical protein